MIIIIIIIINKLLLQILNLQRALLKTLTFYCDINENNIVVTKLTETRLTMANYDLDKSN